MKRIKTGDTVRHKPSGETWTVAHADYEQGVIAWCGWPPGRANLNDCELVESCLPSDSYNLLQALANLPGNDHRKSYALGELVRGVPS